MLRRIGSLVLATGFVCTVSACASSSNHSGDSSGLKGPAIKLGIIAEGSGVGAQLANVSAGAKAAARAINAAGGLKGRPIEIVTCDTHNNPNDAAACARTLVSDGVVALVGSATEYGANALPLLTQSHIASLGQIAVTSADLTNKLGFPLAPVGIDVAAGSPDVLARNGAHKISLARVDVSGTAGLAQLTALGLAPHGLTLQGNIAVPANAADMSSYVASASGKGQDGIALILQPTDLVKFVRAAKSAGYKGKFGTGASGVQQLINQGFGDALEGVYLVDVARPASDTSNAAVQSMTKQIRAVDSKIVIDYTVEDAWASVYLFKAAAANLSKIDAAGVTGAMPTVTNFTTGVFPAIDFSKPLTGIPGLHVFNPDVFYDQIKNGTITPVSDSFVKLLS
jgi:ABC-type branched-subunit amino acid transport system substrate-binding protein